MVVKHTFASFPLLPVMLIHTYPYIYIYFGLSQSLVPSCASSVQQRQQQKTIGLSRGPSICMWYVSRVLKKEEENIFFPFSTEVHVLFEKAGQEEKNQFFLFYFIFIFLKKKRVSYNRQLPKTSSNLVFFFNPLILFFSPTPFSWSTTYFTWVMLHDGGDLKTEGATNMVTVRGKNRWLIM